MNMKKRTLILILLVAVTWNVSAALSPTMQEARDRSTLQKYVDTHPEVKEKLKNIQCDSYYGKYNIYYGNGGVIIFGRKEQKHPQGWVGPAPRLVVKKVIPPKGGEKEAEPAQLVEVDYDRQLRLANTTAEMNEAVGNIYADADAELNRVYATIRSVYANQPLFLEKMKLAQRNWIKQRDADFLMMYPHADEPGYYGSIFDVEAGRYQAIQTKLRTAYLRRWLIGTKIEECSGYNGSLMSKKYLKKVLGEEYPRLIH